MNLVGVDTNVLLRAVTDDDPRQSALVRRFLTGEDDRQIFVNSIVLVELVWTLRTQFGYPRERILDLVAAFLERTDIEFSDRESVVLALDICRRRKLDLADAMIAAGNLAAGCRHTLTFDRNAAQSIPGMELLS